jgi:hypothetical protein
MSNSQKMYFLIFSTALAFGLTGCAAEPQPTALAAISPTAVPPTTVPTPEFTPTPLVYQPPADQYMPLAGDVGTDYEAESSLISENLAAQASLPVPPENLAVASFRNRGGNWSTDPQNGTYYRMTWWVVLAENESNARFLYGLSQNPDYAKSAFLLVMPAAIQEKMDTTTTVEMKESRCDDAAVSSYVSDTYAVFRQGGVIPTLGPLMEGMPGNNTPEELAKLPPDLFLFASCRVNNAVILFWGHAPSNFDGTNSPIPDEVIAGQVREKFDLVIDKLIGK